jgi:hypothetical protein
MITGIPITPLTTKTMSTIMVMTMIITDTSMAGTRMGATTTSGAPTCTCLPML